MIERDALPEWMRQGYLWIQLNGGKAQRYGGRKATDRVIEARTADEFRAALLALCEAMPPQHRPEALYRLLKEERP